MMVFELLYLAMLLVRVAVWCVRVLVLLHLALIVVAMPAGLLVRAGVIEDVGTFATVSCAWAALLLVGWFAVVRRRAEAPRPVASWNRRGAPGRSRARPVRG